MCLCVKYSSTVVQAASTVGSDDDRLVAILPMSGILEGTLTDFGDYDECFNSQSLNSPYDVQYCTLEGRPLLPARPRFHNLVHPLYNFYNLSRATSSPLSPLFMENVHYFYYITFRLGLCLPAQCSVRELNSFISDGECAAGVCWWSVLFFSQPLISCLLFCFSPHTVASEKLAIQVRVTQCESRPEYQSLNIKQIIALLVVTALIALSAIGTLAHYLQVDCVMCDFSVPRNLHQVLHGKSTEATLSCLHGIRVLTMGWVVMGHTYALTNHQAFGQ